MILYGRNDAHGYNLHKRGALSLNALAQVLTDPADELIFVDYNTPDELPTFPEAIADTLTDQCKARLRIMRVRPDYHAQFLGKTRLVALECQSRNIAARRANPDNRWLLSTNTDMIFCPKNTKSGLSTVVGALEDGFYHLPRFDVPEGFWERLDRLDPEAAIRTLRDHGREFHLNEVVYGYYDNLYDGPGDFQLFTRQDYFHVHGFDERMIHGWHADANMARRMKLLRGEVRTAFDAIYGYHCGHTRQATSLHGGGVRIENDQVTFVSGVTDSRAPWQADDWGAPNWEFEEVRLTAPDRYFSALSAAVSQAGPDYSEAALSVESFGKVAYNTSHVLPHLCDLLFNLPAGRTIFYFGDDAQMAEGLRAFLEEANKDPRFLLGEGFDPQEGLEQARWAGDRLPIEDAIERADVIVVQYPSYERWPNERRRMLQWLCERLLTNLADIERAKPPHLRRRILIVNGIHNAFSLNVELTLAPTSMPFSSRLRQGFVVDTLPAANVTGLAASEKEVLTSCLEGLATQAPPPGWERLALELASVLALPEDRDAYGVSQEAAALIEPQVNAALAEAVARCVRRPREVGPRGQVGTRLCSGADWCDHDWITLGRRYFGFQPTAFMGHGRWAWERISLALNLLRECPADGLAKLAPAASPRVLCVTAAPDFLVALLAHAGYQVTYATVAELAAGAAVPSAWEAAISVAWLETPPTAKPFERRAGARPDFDAVVANLPAFGADGWDELKAFLANIDPMIRPGAPFLASANVQLNEKLHDGAYSYGEWNDLFSPQGPLGSRGFKPLGAVDTTIPLDTAVRFSEGDRQGEATAGMSYGFLGSLMTVGVVAAEWPEALGEGANGRLSYDSQIMKKNSLRLGRRSALDRDERALVVQAIQGLAQGTPLQGWERLAPEIAATTASDRKFREFLGVTLQEAKVAYQASDRAMRSAIADLVRPPSAVEGRATVHSRLCSGADWDEPDWLDRATRTFRSGASELSQRTPWVWERVSLLHNLLRSAGSSDAKVLLLTPAPDALSHLISHLGFDVTCATLGELLQGEDSSDAWAAMMKSAWLKPVRKVRFWTKRPANLRFDVVVCSQQTLLEHGEDHCDRVMAAVLPLLAPGATLHAGFAAHLDVKESDGAISQTAWCRLFAADGSLGARGLTRIGEQDDRIPLDTAIRFAVDNDAQETIPGLSYSFDNGFVTAGVTSAAWPSSLPDPLSRPGPPPVVLEPFDPLAIDIPYGRDPADDLDWTGPVPLAEQGVVRGLGRLRRPAESARKAMAAGSKLWRWVRR